WERWEIERRVIGAANLVVNEVAPGPKSPTTDNPYLKKDKSRKLETGAERRMRRREEKPNKHTEDREDGEESEDRDTSQCRVCGRDHGGTCRLANHPDANKSDRDWKDSEKGKKWRAKGEHVLPPRRLLNGDKWVDPGKQK